MASDVLFPEVFVVSLDRTPERYEFVSNQLSDMGIDHHRFSAVDGYNVELVNMDSGESFTGADLAQKKVILEKESNYWVKCLASPQNFVAQPEIGFFKYGNAAVNLTAGELGVTCSHRYIWNYIYTHDIPYSIVLEDDVFFIRDLDDEVNNILKSNINPDLLYLCPMKDWDSPKKTHDINVITLEKNRIIAGTHAYMISKETAGFFLILSSQLYYPMNNHVANMFFMNNLNVLKIRNEPCGTIAANSVIDNMGRAPRQLIMN